MTSVKVIRTAFMSNGEKVRGNFVLPSGKGPYPGICKFHGFPGSSDQTSGIATELAKAGFAVLTFDFRGFRKSEGIFSLAGVIKDAENAVTHLLNSEWIDSDTVAVYGASFGGAVAICIASLDDRISAVAVRAPVYNTESFFASDRLESVIQFTLQMAPNDVRGLSDPMLRRKIINQLKEDVQKYNPVKIVHKIAPRPLLIVTGDRDQLIDANGVRTLYEKAGKPKLFVIVKGADHVLSSKEAYQKTNQHIISWFKTNHPGRN